GLRCLVGLQCLVGLFASPAVGADDWENPVFEEADAAVRVALRALEEPVSGEAGALELFKLFTLSSKDRPNDPRFSNVRRRVVDSFLVTLPDYLESESKAKRTLESFLAEVEDEKARIGSTVERFGYPPLPGLTYLKLVENVEALQRDGRPASGRREQIQGVTYYCRYVVIPLSYITPQRLEELRGSALDPHVDVNATLRAWERDSFRVMLSTFRHELIHVFTNSSLGPPRYRDRQLYPTWFLEGSAAFLAADPHAGLSEDYKDYQNLFFYLVESKGVEALRAFFEHILSGATVSEGLEKTYGIEGASSLRQKEASWRSRKQAVGSVLAIALLLVVVLSLTSHRIPVFGSLQLWLAVTLAYSAFSGFCEKTQALNGANAVRTQQVILVAVAAYLTYRGIRSVRRNRRAK
ncbi:MAG: hypothetical protein AAF657_25845, partial [Acidobacteriota bacterium]